MVSFDVLKVFGNDGLSCSFSLHVTSGSASLYPCLLNAFGIITNECCKDEVRGFLSAEFTFVFVKVDCHDT